MQQHIADERGNQLEGYDALGYIRKVTADSFKKSVERISPVSKSMKESATDEELVLENFNWTKAGASIRKRTAPGLDRVPVSLINELGHNTKGARRKMPTRQANTGQLAKK